MFNRYIMDQKNQSNQNVSFKQLQGPSRYKYFDNVCFSKTQRVQLSIQKYQFQGLKKNMNEQKFLILKSKVPINRQENQPKINSMKQNKPPMFVKLHLPQTDQINKNQLISLWNHPHPKQFHVIDNPSIINKIANQINLNRRQYSSVKTVTQPSEPAKDKKPLYVVKRTKKSSERMKFSKLNKQVNCLSEFIENQVSQLNHSQIFHYKQKMLATFLQNFFEQLQTECHQKASFIRQIWNQAIVLFDRVFQKQNQNYINYQKNSLNEIISLHKSYQQMFQKMKKQKLNLIKESEKYKELIKSLVRNIKQRKKQIKVFQGGIHDYNNRINDMSAQFTQLKKEHLDILMYGYQGNMTKQQAQNLLSKILKPLNQDQEDLRQLLSVKYIPPKLPKGKSDKYLSLINDNESIGINETQIDNQLLKQNKDLSLFCEPYNYVSKQNFVPKKLKYYQKCIDAKVQTESQNIGRQKVSESTQCSYFSRMEDLQIKNKYCQTQNKKLIKINTFCQSDLSGNQAFIELKRAKLKILGHLIETNLLNLDKNTNSEQKTQRMKTIFTLMKSQIQFQGDFDEDQWDQNQVKSDQKRLARNKQNMDRNKLQKKFNNKKLKSKQKIDSAIKEVVKQPKGQFKKGKTRIKTKPQEEAEPIIKSFIKTQNFIRANKARLSSQNKNILMHFYSNNQSILPLFSGQQIMIGLLRCFLNQQHHYKNSLNQRQSLDSVEIQLQNQLILSNNWPNQIYKLLNKIKIHPSESELDIALYYNTKKQKNKNISQQNNHYFQKIKTFILSFTCNAIPKKNDLNSITTHFQTFTLKKSYKIIHQVFKVGQRICAENNFKNINFIHILQRLFSPQPHKAFNYSIAQITPQNQSMKKTIQFLKYLIRNINENYLFKNFLFLCGIQYKIQQSQQKELRVININKNTQIGQQQGEKKTMHIETIVKNKILQKQMQDFYKNKYGTMTYSSQIVFYLDMVKALNCYSSSGYDIQNSYTTMEMMQKHFQKLSKHYKDEKLIKTIKEVIEQSVRHTALRNSKLNIFKCLHIFLEKIRQRKIQMIQSYIELDEFAKNKNQAYLREHLLVDILSLVKAPAETQLKLISKFLKKFEEAASFQDLMTFFVIEGFPEMNFVEQSILKSARQLQYGACLGSGKVSNLVLEYLQKNSENKNHLKQLKVLSQVNASYRIQETVEKQIQGIIGKDLNHLSISHIFITSQERTQFGQNTMSKKVENQSM